MFKNNLKNQSIINIDEKYNSPIFEEIKNENGNIEKINMNNIYEKEDILEKKG